ncbi:helix-turn-helix domain-containing protein [Saccharopolyspora sp. NPDC047091]|uniref:helix-turn-helix domain-containing protein n=1 Tax=Saccharopolyspora sp. NPDC047091 TaxID=3155924 RepID=UPI0033F1F540
MIGTVAPPRPVQHRRRTASAAARSGPAREGTRSRAATTPTTGPCLCAPPPRILPNTVRYRLRRIREPTGRSLTDAELVTASSAFGLTG